jgi:hypothetical protein
MILTGFAAKSRLEKQKKKKKKLNKKVNLTSITVFCPKK